MTKTYVLDTNILLYSPQAIYAFDEHVVVIPEVVIEEVDKFKSETGERGYNSREFIRVVDQLRQQGNIIDGVPINDNGGILRIEANHLSTEMPPYWDSKKADNRILQVCKGLRESEKDTILVSRDTNMRVKATIINVPAEDFRNDKVASVDKQYTGRITVYTGQDIIAEFYKSKSSVINPADVKCYDEEGNATTPELVINQFLEIHSYEKPDGKPALGRFDGRKIVRLVFEDERPFGVKPRNVGQIFLQECLMMGADKAPLVIVKGPAGTAKTFYSLACGLNEILEKQEKRNYNRVLICRPNVPMDEDIGFLPGGEQEKIDPYMRGIRDNLFTLFSNNKEAVSDKDIAQIEDTIAMLLNEGKGQESKGFDKDKGTVRRNLIQMEALAYQRGRSLNHYWFILDEMQNSTNRQAKGVITRAGLGSKIILLGDPAQIDHPYLDTQSNGLVYASEKMKGSALCFQITLDSEECERSVLAQEASERM